MRTRLVGAVAATACAVLTTSKAVAAVDLVLRAQPQTVDVGMDVEVGLYGVSNEDTEFSAIDVLLTWDPTVLELRGVDNGSHTWGFVFGFEPDAGRDRLNADCGEDTFCDPYTGLPFNDGDTMFEAASFTPGIATEKGLLIATFRFEALAYAPETRVVIESELGGSSRTQVLQPGGEEVTGSLGSASVTITSTSLWAVDMTMPAGRTAEVLVRGTILGESTFGVETLVQIVSRSGNTGTVTFTLSPQADIVQHGDPWPLAGTFTPFDTDSPGFSETLNGSADDNGSFLGAPLTYSGPLSAFPVKTSADAHGVWDIKLCRASCTRGLDDVSAWSASPRDPLPAVLRHGVLKIVDLADGNGDGAIDVRDFSEFQACFTDSVGPAYPPVYPLTPELRCSVYDFDDDGVVDAADYGAFHEVMSGPGP